MTLEEVYKAAYEDGVFFAEYSSLGAAAGDLRDLEWLAAHADPPRDAQTLLDELISSFMGAIIDLCVLSKVKSEDRVTNCQSAWGEFKVAREAGAFPKVVEEREKLGLPIHDPHQLGTF